MTREEALKRKAELDKLFESLDCIPIITDDPLTQFIESIKKAPQDQDAERAVRFAIAGAAKSCPMEVLLQLGQCLVDCRKEELRREAEAN